jgi:hypothetical protein
VGASHDDNSSAVPLFHHLGDLQSLLMIGSEGGGDTEDLGLRCFDSLPDLVPSHAEVIIAAIEFEGASVVKGVELIKVRKFIWDRDGSAFPGLAVENLYLVSPRLERGRKIGQTDRLGSDRGLIEILNRWLDEENLHSESDSTRSTIMKLWLDVYFS